MSESPLPPWDDEGLERLLSLAQYNERASSINYPDVFEVLGTTDRIFATIGDCIETHGTEVLLLSRILAIRIRSNFLGGVRLSLSGQNPEAASVLRGCLESSWYAYHIAADPEHPRRGRIWLERTNSPQAKKACIDEFRPFKIVEGIRSRQPRLASHSYNLYENLIDFGAHPNELGVFSSVTREDLGESTKFDVGIFRVEEGFLLPMLGTALMVAIDSMKILGLVFPERFRIMSIDDDVESLHHSVKQVFTHYGYGPTRWHGA